MFTDTLKTEPLGTALPRLLDECSDKAFDTQISNVKATLGVEDDDPTVQKLIERKHDRESESRGQIADGIITVAADFGIELDRKLGKDSLLDAVVSYNFSVEDIKDRRRDLVCNFISNSPGGATLPMIEAEFDVGAMTAKGDTNALVTQGRLTLDQVSKHFQVIQSA